MKKSINLLDLVCPLIFSLFFSITIDAQTISKTFTKEIQASEGGSVFLEGRSLKFYMSGTIHSSRNDEGYVLKSKKNEPPVLVIANLKVKTWDKPIVKQQITINVTPTSGGQKIAADLLKNLELNLLENSEKIIAANNNLNIKRFEMINGIFRRDRNSVVLENDKTFDFEKLEITSILTIPKSHNLDVKLENMNLEMDELDGYLKIGSTGGSLKAKKLNILEANLMFGNIDVKEINKAIINAHVSHVTIGKVNELTLGSTQIAIEQALGMLFTRRVSDLSSQSTYKIDTVNVLKIQESKNDKFLLGKVGNIESLYSFFSDYKIDALNQSLNLKSKNGDLFIGEIETDFKKIDIFNDVSSINLGIQKLENCLLSLKQYRETELKLPNNFKALENGIFGSKTLLKGNKEKAGKINIRCNQCDVKFNE